MVEYAAEERSRERNGCGHDGFYPYADDSAPLRIASGSSAYIAPAQAPRASIPSTPAGTGQQLTRISPYRPGPTPRSPQSETAMDANDAYPNTDNGAPPRTHHSRITDVRSRRDPSVQQTYPAPTRRRCAASITPRTPPAVPAVLQSGNRFHSQTGIWPVWRPPVTLVVAPPWQFPVGLGRLRPRACLFRLPR